MICTPLTNVHTVKSNRVCVVAMLLIEKRIIQTRWKVMHTQHQTTFSPGFAVNTNSVQNAGEINSKIFKGFSSLRHRAKIVDTDTDLNVYVFHTCFLYFSCPEMI